MSKLNSRQFAVNGMHCASCASIIKKSLEKLPGVQSCRVNYANEKAELEYDPQQISLEQMNEELEKLGYRLQAKTAPLTTAPIAHGSINHDSMNHDQMDHSSMDHSQMADGNADHSQMDHSLHAGHDMAPVGADAQSKKQKLQALAQMKKQLLVLLPFAAISIFMMLWEAGMSLGWLPEIPDITKVFFHHLMPIMATYTLFVAGQQYISAVGRFIRYKVANMDTLVGLGTVVAFVYSFLISAFEKVLEPYINTGIVYYDVTIVVIAFITLGKYLEARSKLKTGEAIEKLLGLQAKTATVLREGKELELPIEQVVVGDVILVKPGQKIPTDAVILEGKTSIDESMITGEVLPVDKKAGDAVVGGTLNKQGSLRLRATQVGQDTVLAQIIAFVENAQGSKAPIEKLADQISAVFVPIVLVFAILVFIAWLVIGSRFYPLSQALSLAVTSLVAVLVIACPCAMGLATPMAVIVGVGKAAQQGILIKNAENLEKFRQIDAIVFDKTGTLTKGKPTLQDWQSVSDLPANKALQILASLEKHSEHPIAQAIVQAAKQKQLSLSPVQNFSVLEGKGVKGNIGKTAYWAGSPALAKELRLQFDAELLQTFAQQGKTPLMLMSKTKVLAVGSISDTIKSEALAVIEKLHQQKIQVAMLTGDQQKTADYIARQLKIDRVFAEVLPVNKAEKIQELQREGHKVAMVGDGINDAPALAVADVGIAMGTGTDIAIESAGITLLGGNLAKIPQAVRLAQLTLTTIKQNLFWAFFYNVLSIPIAAGILYPSFGIVLNPAIAGVAMAFSSVTVVLNALRLKAARLQEVAL